MEAWILFAILSTFSIGLAGFIYKIAAENHNNPSQILYYSFLSSAFIGIIIGIVLKVNLMDSLSYVIGFGIINYLGYHLSILIRIKSLQNIDASIYFPISRIIGPILILFLSFLVFNESLEIKEWFGIVLGIMVPLLLISKDENKKQRDLKLGLILLFFSVLITTIAVGFLKFYVEEGFSLLNFIVISQLIALVLAYGNLKISKNIHLRKKFSNKNSKQLGFTLGVLNIITICLFMNALKGNLAVVSVINTFSILIPIILSVIIYKEHFDLKKGIAVVLSIASILFFI